MAIDIATAITSIGAGIFEELKKDLPNDLNKLTKGIVEKLKKCAQRASELAFLAMNGEDVTENVRWINFQLAGLAFLKANELQALFWAKVKLVATRVIQRRPYPCVCGSLICAAIFL